MHLFSKLINNGCSAQTVTRIARKTLTIELKLTDKRIKGTKDNFQRWKNYEAVDQQCAANAIMICFSTPSTLTAEQSLGMHHFVCKELR